MKLAISLTLIGVVATGCSTMAVLHESAPFVVSAAPPAPVEDSAVAMQDTHIQVDEKIQFEFNSSQISSDSDGLLMEIARVINENPDVGRVRVEGHTDRSGSARYNRRLSQRRAQAVMHRLIENGVTQERLESEGYGFSQPIEENDSDEGRAANRRVEFELVDRQ